MNVDSLIKSTDEPELGVRDAIVEIPYRHDECFYCKMHKEVIILARTTDKRRICWDCIDRALQKLLVGD